MQDNIDKAFLPVARGKLSEASSQLLDILGHAISGKVIEKNEMFYLKNKNGELEFPLLAEGYRKLGLLYKLIQNETLVRGTALFWDEPESNLNPALIRVVAEFIRELQKCGLQIFIATHDYLLTHMLSLYSEYKEYTSACVRFFGLHKEESKIGIEEGDTLAAIQNNPILEEYAAFYDLEQKYMSNYE